MKNKRCNTHNKMDEDKKSYIQRMQFQNAMKFKEIAVELSESISDQINLFTFMIQCIIRELEAEEISKIFYVDNNEHIKQPILSPFPEYYTDQYDTDHDLSSNCIVKVDFSKTPVIVQPGLKDKLVNAVNLVWRNGFKNIGKNVLGIYFEYIDLCYVYNGTHTCSAAVIKRQGVIETSCRDMTKLFPHITTDGEWWYNAHTGEKKYKVYDFRFAVLYEIARCKYELEN